jgi:hypothetical protein
MSIHETPPPRPRLACRRCDALRCGDHASAYGIAEWLALLDTGIEGQRDGQPVIRALLLPRRGVVQFADMVW